MEQLVACSKHGLVPLGDQSPQVAHYAGMVEAGGRALRR